MTMKNLFAWFGSTLLIGSLAAFVFGLAIEAVAGQHLLGPWAKQLLLSLTLAAVSELGFFAYLVFNWLSRGLIPNRSIYNGVLILFLALVLGNWAYFNFATYQGTALWLHLFLILLVLVVAITISVWKVKLTEKAAAVPTLFFMSVGTVIEAVPSIQAQNVEIPFFILLHTLLVLLVCNTWQILMLHRWVTKPTDKNQAKARTK